MIWSGLGFNVGNENNGRTQAQWDADFDILKAIGVTKLRIAQFSYNWWVPTGDLYNYNDYTKALALRAKEKGFYVTWGVCGGRVHMDTQEIWDDFVDNANYGVKVHAAWAQANGIDQFQFMNEEEAFLGDSVFSQSQIRDKSRALATELQAIFTRGPISRSVDNVNWYVWTQDAAGRGDIDIMGLNCYSTYANIGVDTFRSRALAWITEFGASNCAITEWNLSAVSSQLSDSVGDTIKIGGRMKTLQDLGYTDTYFFTLRWENSGSDDQYAVFKKNGNKRLWWNVLSTDNGRRFFDNGGVAGANRNISDARATAIRT